MLEATHLVAGGSGVPLKRTPKLLAGLGRCRFVVDVEWLYQSAKEGKLLDGVEFVLCDAEVCVCIFFLFFIEGASQLSNEKSRCGQVHVHLFF